MEEHGPVRVGVHRGAIRFDIVAVLDGVGRPVRDSVAGTDGEGVCLGVVVVVDVGCRADVGVRGSVLDAVDSNNAGGGVRVLVRWGVVVCFLVMDRVFTALIVGGTNDVDVCGIVLDSVLDTDIVAVRSTGMWVCDLDKVSVGLQSTILPAGTPDPVAQE